MNLVAIMPVRNEDWILGFSARAALMWCDRLVALNHCSTDRSRAILEDLARETGRVQIMDSYADGWPEMVHRQQLLDVARAYEATHVALVDADEVLCGNCLPAVRPRIEELPPGCVLNVAMYCMWRGIGQYRSDPNSVWSNRYDLGLAFCDRKQLEYAASPDGYQHHARAPRFSRSVRAPGIGVMHLQFADWRRLTAKHALYKVRERVEYPARAVDQIDSMYNLALDERGLQTTETPAEWLAPYKPILSYMKCSDEPWQETEARRIVQLHGNQRFQGLNLFGVA